MMKNKGPLIVGLIILALILTTVAVYASNKDKFTPPNNPINPNTNPSTNPPTNNSGVPSQFPLKRGSVNDYVRKLQNYLLGINPNCLPKYHADGDWGSETESCVMSILGVNVISYQLYKDLGLS